MAVSKYIFTETRKVGDCTVRLYFKDKVNHDVVKVVLDSLTEAFFQSINNSYKSKK